MMQLFPVTVRRVRELHIDVTTDTNLVRMCINEWHSSSVAARRWTWRVAFILTDGVLIYGVATWGKPCARNEDQLHTLEHSRMALSPIAPRNSATYFLAKMRAWIRTHMPEIRRLISYVTMSKHTGVTYRADNWHKVYEKRTNQSWSKSRPTRRGVSSNHKAKFERLP